MSKKYTSSDLDRQIREYLISHPIDIGFAGCYDEIAKKFGVTSEIIRNKYKRLRKKGLIKSNPISSDSRSQQPDSSFFENVKAGTADVTFITKKRIKTLEDLLEACDVDGNLWEVSSYEVNKWEVGRKDKIVNWQSNEGVGTGIVQDTGKIFVEPLFQVKAKLVRRRLTQDLTLQKRAILEELKTFSPHVKLSLQERQQLDAATYLLELCLFDLHFGKLGWHDETGENYDLKIAEKRFKDTIKDLLDQVNLTNIKKILLPLGNDMINIDNRENTTSNGTPQDSDARYFKIIKIVRRILVETINDLSQIAPVEVIMVPGNHDTTTTFMIGEILDAHFGNNERVTIENAPTPRKYYRFGKNGIQFTHGNEEDHKSLGLIFATAQKKLWAETDFRFCQIGHFHKNKKLVHTSVDEYQGFIVQTIPSLSGKDYWHTKKGYNSLKQAKAFLFHPDTGLRGEFTSTAL